MRAVVVPEPIAVGVPENPVGVHIAHLDDTHGPIGGCAAGLTKTAEDTLGFGEYRNISPKSRKSTSTISIFPGYVLTDVTVYPTAIPQFNTYESLLPEQTTPTKLAFGVNRPMLLLSEEMRKQALR